MQSIHKNITWRTKKRVLHLSKNPSTTVWTAYAIVSFEKKGSGGSDTLEAKDKVWFTIETYAQWQWEPLIFFREEIQVSSKSTVIVLSTKLMILTLSRGVLPYAS